MRSGRFSTDDPARYWYGGYITVRDGSPAVLRRIKQVKARLERKSLVNTVRGKLDDEDLGC